MAELKQAKWLFFDVGFTLVDETKVWIKRTEEQAHCHNALGKSYSAKELHEALVQSVLKYNFKYEQIMQGLGYDEFAPFRNEYETLYPNVEKVLDALLPKYRLGIIANQPMGLIRRFEEWKLDKYFDVVVSSFEEGIKKPNVEMFTRALERAHCDASDAVMIADRLDNDVFPAKKVGLQTVRICQGIAKGQTPANSEYVPDFVVNSIEDLLDLFG